MRRPAGLSTQAAHGPASNGEPGGAELVAGWEQRAPTFVEYGAALRSQFPSPSDRHRISGAMASVLHMHYNRLLGGNMDNEAASYAVARGAVQADRDRARFVR